MEALGPVAVHKLRAHSVVSELGVHGCARSRSQDSGLVADFESCQDVPALTSCYKTRSVEESLQCVRNAAAVKKGFGHSRSMSNPLERRSNFSLAVQMNAISLNRSCDDPTALCGRLMTKRHSATVGLDHTVSSDELDQSADTIEPDEPVVEAALEVDGEEQEDEDADADAAETPLDVTAGPRCMCEDNARHCASCAEGEDACGDLDSQKLALRLDISPPSSSACASDHRVRTISECSEGDGPGRPGRRCRDRTRSGCRAPAPKQSWLLRLFESKLFDMSIAIQYLFNSKEPGVQTYIGESF